MAPVDCRHLPFRVNPSGTMHRFDQALLAVTFASFVTVLGVVWHYYPNNHWGVDLLWPAAGGGLILAYALCRLLVSRSRSRVLGWLCSVATILLALSIAADVFNVLVNYDKWLRRGMPKPWSLQWTP